MAYFWRVVWQYLTASFGNVHTCFSAIPHLRIYLKEIIKVVFRDFKDI